MRTISIFTLALSIFAVAATRTMAAPPAPSSYRGPQNPSFCDVSWCASSPQPIINLAPGEVVTDVDIVADPYGDKKMLLVTSCKRSACQSQRYTFEGNKYGWPITYN